MRGLDDAERFVMESLAPAGSFEYLDCDKDWCGGKGAGCIRQPETVVERLLSRGLIAENPCAVYPEERHVEITTQGRYVLALVKAVEEAA